MRQMCHQSIQCDRENLDEQRQRSTTTNLAVARPWRQDSSKDNMALVEEAQLRTGVDHLRTKRTCRIRTTRQHGLLQECSCRHRKNAMAGDLGCCWVFLCRGGSCVTAPSTLHNACKGR